MLKKLFTFFNNQPYKENNKKINTSFKMENNERYDFAFSFSGEEIRQKVIEIAKELKNLGFKVFIDKWYTKEMQKVFHPKEYLTDVFMSAKHIILVLNHKYMRMLEMNYDCQKDFNPEQGCYIKHEMSVISKRFNENPGCLMRITVEDGRFDLKKYGINLDTTYKKLNTPIILEHFEYKDKLRLLQSSIKENKLQIMKKIVKLFEFHDINLEEYPLFVKEFTYYIIENDKYYETLNPCLINKIADKFKINKQVFYGNDNQFYYINGHGFSKNVKSFTDYVYNEIYMKNGKMYILSEKIPNKEIDEKNKNNRFALIFQLPLFDINNKQIYTYEIYDDTCFWGYWKCRFNLKSFLLCLRKKGVFDSFWQGNIIRNEKCLYDNLENFALGNIKFESFINRIDWYPEDFIDSPKKNMQAKESDELEKIEKCKSYF